MEAIEFDKYVAAGNDFIIFDGKKDLPDDYGKLALTICDRHFGLGADGIMVSKESSIADIKMVYYNSDGSQGEMCGNGIRSFSKFIFEKGIIRKKSISIETLAGIQYVEIFENSLGKAEKISVNMGQPIWKGKDIPTSLDKEEVINETIVIDDKAYLFSAILMGVPHVVIFVEDIKNIDINGLGREIEVHDYFPRKTNVNFIEVVDRDKINIYTWERGAGRTLGCGTGSTASVLIGNRLGLLNDYVQVKTEGGSLEISIADDYNAFMIGSANHIGQGIFYF